MSDDWLRSRAKAMRHEPTVHERRLWKLLRDRRLADLKFRRQVVIGGYIADFVCFRHRLIVEADGPFHQTDRDAVRDAALARLGFRVLRFPNPQVENRDWEVVGAIREAVRANRDAGPLI